MSDTGKELLLSSLTSFYAKNENYKYMLKNIIDGKHILSLRMIDWLVTRYAKNNNIIYWITDSSDELFYMLPETYNAPLTDASPATCKLPPSCILIFDPLVKSKSLFCK